MTKREELERAARGEGCLGRSQDDEPVFVLVARDRYAAQTVREWADTVAFMHGPSPKTDEARQLADRMDAWREAHGGGKVPD